MSVILLFVAWGVPRIPNLSSKPSAYHLVARSKSKTFTYQSALCDPIRRALKPCLPGCKKTGMSWREGYLLVCPCWAPWSQSVLPASRARKTRQGWRNSSLTGARRVLKWGWRRVWNLSRLNRRGWAETEWMWRVGSRKMAMVPKISKANYKSASDMLYEGKVCTV